MDTVGVLDFCLESQHSCSLQSDFLVLFKCKYRNQVSITIGEGMGRMNQYSLIPTVAYVIFIIVLRECKFVEIWNFGLFLFAMVSAGSRSACGREQSISTYSLRLWLKEEDTSRQILSATCHGVTHEDRVIWLIVSYFPKYCLN